MKNAGKLLIKDSNIEIASQVLFCEGLAERMRGLIGRKLESYEALLIQPCWSIHTFFMKEIIDIIFVDKNLQILKIEKNLMPFKISICPGAYGVIEMPSNTLDKFRIGKDTVLTIQ